MTPSLEQATEARIMELRDLLASGAGELAGKAKREYGEAEWDVGKVIGRFRGLSRDYPELVTIHAPRQNILRAIFRRKGPLYERIVYAVRRQMEYEGFVPRRKRKPGRPTIEAHPGRSAC